MNPEENWGPKARASGKRYEAAMILRLSTCDRLIHLLRNAFQENGRGHGREEKVDHLLFLASRMFRLVSLMFFGCICSFSCRSNQNKRTKKTKPCFFYQQVQFLLPACPVEPHELTDIACLQNGSCLRGDACKFNHDVPVTGLPHPSMPKHLQVSASSSSAAAGVAPAGTPSASSSTDMEATQSAAP